MPVTPSATTIEPSEPMTKQHYNVIIAGAGLSGVGMACHLTMKAPHKSYQIFEGRDAIGGTWDLFRYPGIRAGSDMVTLGDSFRPWTNRQAIADGHTVREYISDTADEYGVRDNIRFNHRIESANGSSEDSRWHVTVKKKGQRKKEVFTCDFFVGCTGYRSEEHTSELQSRGHLVCRLLLEKKRCQ